MRQPATTLPQPSTKASVQSFFFSFLLVVHSMFEPRRRRSAGSCSAFTAYQPRRHQQPDEPSERQLFQKQPSSDLQQDRSQTVHCFRQQIHCESPYRDAGGSIAAAAAGIFSVTPASATVAGPRTVAGPATTAATAVCIGCAAGTAGFSPSPNNCAV